MSPETKEKIVGSRLKFSRLNFKQPKVTVEFLLAALLLLVVIFEAGFLYFFLYKNLFFKEKTSGQKTVSDSIRINFENYEKVVKRLDEVASYAPPISINFSSLTEGIGRDNPFADP